MASYSFQIRKADHPNQDGTLDLHVHVFFNEGKSRKLIGRYRLPSLEPVFPAQPELNKREIELLRKWLAQGEQIRKLQNFLEETLFDLHRMKGFVSHFSEINTEGGETYINIRIPVSRRIT